MDAPSLVRKYLRRKAFLPPGSLPPREETDVSPSVIRLLRYNLEQLHPWQQRDVSGVSECASDDLVTWIDVEGIADPDTLLALGNEFQLHPLVLEDIANITHNPKLEEHETYLFVLAKRLRFDPDALKLSVTQVSVIFLPRVVITFRETGDDPFVPLRSRIENHRGRIRQFGPAYLLHAILDTLVDEYFLVLEDAEDVADSLESAVQSTKGEPPLRRIHRLRRQGIRFRRNVRPLREIASTLSRGETHLLNSDVQDYMRDLYDHCIQIIDAAETLRDTLSVLLDLHLSTISNRMNATMQTLTIVATIFIPLTFIAGIYGMNFKFMPELDFPWAYPAALGLMLLTAIGMVVFFRTRKWM